MHQRDLPWRHSNDPYKIWLSEIILQQTRVSQGLPYYLIFEENYPSVEDLAGANIDELLKLWQGLGYYSRAHNLHKCAQMVVDKFDGNFPTSKLELLKLPGIGDYTASAIASIAFGEKEVVLDGNVFRLLSRHFGIEDFIDTSAGRAVFKDTAEKLIRNAIPGEFNQAMMEFGALQCTPKSPDCGACPLNISCVAFAKNSIAELPRKRGKIIVKNMHISYFCFVSKSKLAMVKRDNLGIWKGLYEIPCVVEETEKTTPWDSSKELSDAINHSTSFRRTVQLRHQLSHRKITATFFICDLKNQGDLELPAVIWVDSNQLFALAIPRLIDKFFKTRDGLAVQAMLKS